MQRMGSLVIAEDSAAKPELIEGYAHLCFEDQGSWFRGILITTDGTSYTLTGKKVALDLDRQLTSAQMDENGIPDVVRDFTSPLARSRVGSFDLARPAIENNAPATEERELQFILEDPEPYVEQEGVVSSSSSSSRPGSPPSSQQIVRALDALLLKDTSDASGESSPIVSMNLGRSLSRSLIERSDMTTVYDVTVSDLEDATQHLIRQVGSRNSYSSTLRNRQFCFSAEKAYWGQRADLVIQKQLAAADLVGRGCHVFAGPLRFYFTPANRATSDPCAGPAWCW